MMCLVIMCLACVHDSLIELGHKVEGPLSLSSERQAVSTLLATLRGPAHSSATSERDRLLAAVSSLEPPFSPSASKCRLGLLEYYLGMHGNESEKNAGLLCLHRHPGLRLLNSTFLVLVLHCWQ